MGRGQRLAGPPLRMPAWAMQHVGMDQAAGYNALMHEVCVGLGFCGSVIKGEPSHVDFLIPEHGPVSAEQFADWVFQAEGTTDVEAIARFSSVLRGAFVRHMGSPVVDAARLKWDAL